MYGFIPRTHIDLLPPPSSVHNNLDATQHVELILQLHATVKQNIERTNAKYKMYGDKGRKELVFEPGDLVWLHFAQRPFS